MTTLATMKERIADELMRSDLTSQIGYAIGDAIKLYQQRPWAFAQSRSNTLTTVASQYVYTSADAAWIDLIRKFDWMHLLRTGASSPLKEMDPGELERLNGNGSFGGEPLGYAFYAGAILIYPVPNEAVSLRVGGRFAVAAPTDDNAAGNAWMTTGEQVVRQKAKWLLAKNVIHDDALAQRIEVPLLEAESDMQQLFNDTRRGERNRVEATQF